MKVGISTQNESCFYYPDVQVSCEEEGDQYYNQSPCLIIEVLSTSTARTDRTEKLHAYQQIPSLQEYLLCSRSTRRVDKTEKRAEYLAIESVQEYVLIEQDVAEIEIQRRCSNWQPEYYYLGQDITFESVGITVSVSDIYQRVENEDVVNYLKCLKDDA